MALLHVRVICPSEQTDTLISELSSIDAVLNLLVQRGGAIRPTGDVVQFDLLADAANPVLRRLRALELDRRGAISIDRIDASLGGPSSGSTGEPDPGDHETEPVWELVESGIRTGAVYPLSFYVLLVIASLLAAVGILTNSQILIVGAMVVGPEYGAILGIALGITARDRQAVMRGSRAMAVGFPLAIAATLTFSLIIRWSGHKPAAYLLGVRPVSALISSPNFFSIVVAVLAGIVGVVSMTESRTSTLIGVSLAFSNPDEAWGSVQQLLLNVVVLTAVGCATLALQRQMWRWRSERRTRART